MADRVHIDFRKWPDTRHWQFTMRRLGEDEHGTWLWAPPGMVFRRGEDAPRVARSLHVKLITRDSWWTAIWNSAGKVELYVDIATPARWSDSKVTMVDLDLDVARYLDGRVEVLDEEEFAAHQVELGYPSHIVDRARTTTAAVFLDVQARRPPFDATGRSWLQRAAEVADSR